eukprot:TRINITY_DN28278_c0_g1_i6.p1 TRINITY_DN28278_c0_g1~~TRINITY_DN28278_c0_g1_i6.p1  ORF type:complete len:113 (-),score=1.95 TRINITY_DN28278_c0_g1_i6:1103-1441(-)
MFYFYVANVDNFYCFNNIYMYIFFLNLGWVGGGGGDDYLVKQLTLIFIVSRICIYFFHKFRLGSSSNIFYQTLGSNNNNNLMKQLPLIFIVSTYVYIFFISLGQVVIIIILQ